MMSRPWWRALVDAVLAAEYTVLPLNVRGAHYTLLAIATKHAAQGAIPDCKNWPRRLWERYGGLTRRDVERVVAARLAQWDGDSLTVFGYDVDGEAKAAATSETKRNNAKSGWSKRATAKRPQGDRDADRDRDRDRDRDGDADGDAEQLSPPSQPTSKPKPVRKSKQVDEQHRITAVRIWEKQNAMRQQVDPAVRGLKATDVALAPVIKLLASGNDEDDCNHVLEVYAAEARACGSLKWFDGAGLWRPENFQRALGKRITDAARPRGGAPNSTGNGIATIGRAEPDLFQHGSRKVEI